MKTFDSIEDASEFSACPVSDEPCAPGASEGEAPKFPSVKQVDLLRLRRYIESNSTENIEACISENPMFLLTGYDTPTILQVNTTQFKTLYYSSYEYHFWYCF